MKLFKHQSSALDGQAPNQRARRGAALMLSFLVLIILIMIVQQIKYSSDSEARVARNAETIWLMDQAIESVLLQAYEDLRSDSDGTSNAAGADSGAEFGGGGAAPAGGEDAGATDSRADAWAKAQRTEMNGFQLRIFVQDEDSKLNILSLLHEDEEQAELAFDRLTRVLANFRADTTSEVSSSDARAMAEAMREYMQRRDDQYSPRPGLISHNEEQPDQGFPQTLRDFTAIDPRLFPENLFVDFRDEEDQIVHSICSFLTVFSCLRNVTDAAQGANAAAGGAEPAAGGGAGPEALNADGRINVNTAPPVVLRALLDSRELPYDFWDDIIEYRNEPEEESEDLEQEDIPLDEFGEEEVAKRFFESFERLSEVDSWERLDKQIQEDLQGLLKVESSVFSIYVTARKLTGKEEIDARSSPNEIESQEEASAGLVRTVRSVVWRQTDSSGEATIVPLIRWEVLNYVPREVLDYSREKR